jgi:hypothetical protein
VSTGSDASEAPAGGGAAMDTTAAGGPRPDATASPTKPHFEWDVGLEDVLDSWKRRAWASQIAHYKVASRLRVWSRLIGLPTVILTTVVGTSIFATIDQKTVDVDVRVRVIVGAITIGAAVFSGIQTFFGFAQRADQHVLAADWYSSIRRHIEQVKGTPRDWRHDPNEVLDSIRKEMNQVGSQFPEIGQRTWKKLAPDFGVDEPPHVDVTHGPRHELGRHQQG